MALCLNPIIESKYQGMKKMILIMAVVTFSVIAPPKVSAQVRFNVNLNIGNQPEWGPAGYGYAEYYYLPDIDVYYNVPQRQFIYFSNGRWMFETSLPARYGSYNLFNSYKVVINEPKPYLHHEVYRTKYSIYKGWYGRQANNNNNNRYRSYKGHGNNWNNGHGNNWNNGNGNNWNNRGHGHH
jgi:hypothetical protein